MYLISICSTLLTNEFSLLRKDLKALVGTRPAKGGGNYANPQK